MPELNKYISDVRLLVEAKLDEVLPEEQLRPSELHRAMRYGVMGEGKRIRAVLCVSSCVACGGMADKALRPAAALEMLHAYTLIHDDLPAMDDDDLRRGKPSCHKAFGEAEAILAGDALLTLAFEVLAASEPPKPYAASDLVLELARSSGSCGLVGGQYEDIKANDHIQDEATLKFIQINKTGALIKTACRLGGMIAGATPVELEVLDSYGILIGTAFQIVDDILDETGSQELLGKPIGSDRCQGKMTSVTLYGLEGARRKAATLIEKAKNSLGMLPGQTHPLEQMADMFIDRDS